MIRIRSNFLLLSVLALCLSVVPCSTLTLEAAEVEPLTLIFEGDKIGKIDFLDSAEPEILVTGYYGELEGELRKEILDHRRKLFSLIPDYEVAFTAADSAELSSVLDEMDMHWQSIRKIHYDEFTREVVDLLGSAYGQQLPERLNFTSSDAGN